MHLDATTMEFTSAGHLILQLPAPLPVRLRYAPWEQGMRVSLWTAKDWAEERLDPGLPLLQAAASNPEGTALQGFVERIPARPKTSARRYRYLQTSMLQWSARTRSGAELLEQAPTLLWLLLDKAIRKQWSDKAIAGMLSRRRADTLLYLTGRRSEAMVKFLNRVALCQGDLTELHTLKRFLRESNAWQSMTHFQRIPIHLLEVLRRYPELAGTQLLREIADLKATHVLDGVTQIRHAFPLWRDTLNLGTLLNISDAPQALAHCTSFEAVQRLHDRWMNRLNRRSHLITAGRNLFPAPPIPGNAVIHPILTEEDLRAEGVLMNHCVASYAARVRRGESYLYRLLQPQRATIEIRLTGSKPVIGQFKLAHNQAPDDASRAVVHQWLREDGHAAPDS
ncbi:hypothetical protein G3480_22675 [Thiorhodococcus mannitoliphagus]|uniref:PcfJ-like protein n=1 Tax=Thiorhodococcus mannitoliphagus TaxID=329406 RepID=A0A6P1DXL9_9GAMM|nr:PcfJ domain-containing protein [Thiorhodococcus mannitoliphagus]NEX23067.1 hypothetical protein [Thiorhodococcus mannitoliphagus]